MKIIVGVLSAVIRQRLRHILLPFHRRDRNANQPGKKLSDMYEGDVTYKVSSDIFL